MKQTAKLEELSNVDIYFCNPIDPYRVQELSELPSFPPVVGVRMDSGRVLILDGCHRSALAIMRQEPIKAYTITEDQYFEILQHAFNRVIPQIEGSLVVKFIDIPSYDKST